MGYSTYPRTIEDDTIMQYTAKEQRPTNKVELLSDEIDVKPFHDMILSNPTSAGAVTVNLFNPIDSGYGKPSDVYEHRLEVKDLKGDAGTNNITINDESGAVLTTIATNNQMVILEIINGVWTLMGRVSV